MRTMRILRIGGGGCMTVLDPIRPDERDVSAADQALPRIRDYLVRHREHLVRVVVDDEDAGEALVLPRAAVELLGRVLAHMAAGEGVSVVPTHAELTTQQAADLLNVSRPFLIGLLQAREIEYRLVGKHRRIKAESLLEYLRHDDQRRRAAAAELTTLSRELGL